VTRFDAGRYQDETVALAQLLRRTIEEYRYLLSPLPAPLNAILEKLEPREPRPVPRPPKASVAPSQTADPRPGKSPILLPWHWQPADLNRVAR